MPIQALNPAAAQRIQQRVANGARKGVTLLKAAIGAQGITHSSPDTQSLVQSIRTRITSTDGIPSRIRFRFKRSGVFVHGGYGRGKGGLRGSTWKTRDGLFTRRTNPNSLGLGGTPPRRPKPWYNPTVEALANEISSDLADEMVEVVFTHLTLKGF